MEMKNYHAIRWAKVLPKPRVMSKLADGTWLSSSTSREAEQRVCELRNWKATQLKNLFGDGGFKRGRMVAFVSTDIGENRTNVPSP